MSLNPADDAFAARLRETLPASVFRPVEPRYLEEPRGYFTGHCGVLALPRNTEEVAALIGAAAAARVPVVPYGGGTGLVGGQVAPDGPAPLVISLERMAAIRGIYPQENVIVVEAGAILADVQAAARTERRLFALSLASEGTAQVGGNLSTNAGGTGVLRYGNARDLCLGLEAVMPDGRIWHGLARLRKDNTGYDLKNLLVGAEGTLGVITAAALKLAPLPAATGTAVFVVPSPTAALDLLSLARDRLGEAVSAFELIHGQGMKFLSEVLPEVRLPFDEVPDWCVLVELGLSAGLVPQDALADLYEAAHDQQIATGGTIAQSLTQRDALWAVREHIPEANRRVGAVSSHDISVPISAIPEFIERGHELVAGFGTFRINCFGHVGDGNLHFNVFPVRGRNRADHDHAREALKTAVHDLVHEMGGSISAEHGIGRMKVDDLRRYGDPVRLDAMRAIKAALDPGGIMNPGAVMRALG